MITATYNDSVFINCPFDKEYEKFFQALVFTIYRCGFLPRCAKEIDDAMTFRIDKILRIIEKCKYGIHDISRVNIDRDEFSKLNMPFELGLFWGASKLGNDKQKEKIATIIVGNVYDMGKYFSDLNGVDIKEYKNNEIKLIIKIRNWLLQSSRSRTIPGHYMLLKDFKQFYKALPHIRNELGLNVNLDFIDLSIIIEEWLEVKQKLDDFIIEFTHGDSDKRKSMVEKFPLEEIKYKQYLAYIAEIVEELCIKNNMDIPDWVFG